MKFTTSFKCTLINKRPQEKTSRSSISPISQAAYRTGKFETLGSNFSHETKGLLASSATTIGKSISKFLTFVDPLHCIVSDKLNQEHKN